MLPSFSKRNEMETITTLRDENGNRSSAVHFIVAAVAKHTKNNGFDETPCLPLNIQLIANGIELPFSETIENIYERFEKMAHENIAEKLNVAERLKTAEGLEERARELAKKMCYEMAQKFEWPED